MRQRRLPDWLKTPIAQGSGFAETSAIVSNLKLNTVCFHAMCPNRAECFGRKTLTFMISGNTCTRNCRYCNVGHGVPEKNNPDEPRNIAIAAKALGLKYIVVTSVTRDDLPDYGAGVFAKTVTEIKKHIPGARVELLVPDFSGDQDALNTVIGANPDVLGHNIETVKRLFEYLRPKASYNRSLELFKRAKETEQNFSEKENFPVIKSGLMLGLGETDSEITETLFDLKLAGVSAITLGQYLNPSLKHAPVEKYYTPEEFKRLEEQALKAGFLHVQSSPLTRSSYFAEQIFCS